MLIIWPHSPHSEYLCPLLTSLHIANADILPSHSTRVRADISSPIPQVLSANISYSHPSTLRELITPVSIPTLWVLISSVPVPPKSVLISLAPTLSYSECWNSLSPSTQIVSVGILCPYLHTHSDCWYPVAPSLTKWVLPFFAPTLSYRVLISPVPSSHTVNADIASLYPPTKWELIFRCPILHIVSADIPYLQPPT